MIVCCWKFCWLWWKKENVVVALDFDASGAAPLWVEFGLGCEG